MKVVGIVLGSIFGVIVLLGIVAVNGSRRAHDRMPDGADRTTAFVIRSRTRRGGSVLRANERRAARPAIVANVGDDARRLFRERALLVKRQVLA